MMNLGTNGQTVISSTGLAPLPQRRGRRKRRGQTTTTTTTFTQAAPQPSTTAIVTDVNRDGIPEIHPVQTAAPTQVTTVTRSRSRSRKRNRRRRRGFSQYNGDLVSLFLRDLGHPVGRYAKWFNDARIGETVAGRVYALHAMHPAAIFHTRLTPRGIPDDFTERTYVAAFNYKVRIVPTAQTTWVLIPWSPTLPVWTSTDRKDFTPTVTDFRRPNGSWRFISAGITVYPHRTDNVIASDISIARVPIYSTRHAGEAGRDDYIIWDVPDASQIEHADYWLATPGEGAYVVSFPRDTDTPFAPGVFVDQVRFRSGYKSGSTFTDDNETAGPKGKGKVGTTPGASLLTNRDAIMLQLEGMTPITLKVYGFLEICPTSTDGLLPVNNSPLLDTRALEFVTRCAQTTMGHLPAAANDKDWLTWIIDALNTAADVWTFVSPVVTGLAGMFL